MTAERVPVARSGRLTGAAASAVKLSARAALNALVYIGVVAVGLGFVVGIGIVVGLVAAIFAGVWVFDFLLKDWRARRSASTQKAAPQPVLFRRATDFEPKPGPYATEFTPRPPSAGEAPLPQGDGHP